MDSRFYRCISGCFAKKKLCPTLTSGPNKTTEDVLKRAGKIYLDGTEQPIRRPKEVTSQKDNYSGKKKRHTSKIILISDENKRILTTTPVYVGSSHDFAIFKEEGIEKLLPPKTPIYTDTGFEGIKKIAPKCNIRKPKKKLKKRKLNGGEKLGNRIISKERVKVEHAIGGMKKFKIVADCFRGINFSMDKCFQVTSGLWNLHISLNGPNAVGQENVEIF